VRAIDLLPDADREKLVATMHGAMLEVRLPEGRVESLAAARWALVSNATGEE